ncbi:MAG: hypothetical protein AAGF04_02275 [Chlamydiota bacterium]
MSKNLIELCTFRENYSDKFQEMQERAKQRVFLSGLIESNQYNAFLTALAQRKVTENRRNVPAV